MDNKQENTFWEAIKIFDELGLLEHVMVIGSWAEYLFPPLFETAFVPNIRTRDADFFYRNINIPKEKIPLVKTLIEYGFEHKRDYISEVSKFYKEDYLELEFLTRSLGSASQKTYDIRALGIKSEGLREINILADYACEVEMHGYKIYVPEPAVYVIQKILTNPTRVPAYKKEKDADAVSRVFFHIKQNKSHLAKLKEIYLSLPLKQQKIIKTVSSSYDVLLEFKETIESFDESNKS